MNKKKTFYLGIWFVFILQENQLLIFWFFLFLFRIQEDHPVMSFTLNDTGRLILLNVATQVCMS